MFLTVPFTIEQSSNPSYYKRYWAQHPALKSKFNAVAISVVDHIETMGLSKNRDTLIFIRDAFCEAHNTLPKLQNYYGPRPGLTIEEPTAEELCEKLLVRQSLLYQTLTTVAENAIARREAHEAINEARLVTKSLTLRNKEHLVQFFTQKHLPDMVSVTLGATDLALYFKANPDLDKTRHLDDEVLDPDPYDILMDMAELVAIDICNQTGKLFRSSPA